jgi:dihydroorotase
MTRKILIKNAQLVNEYRVFSSDVRISEKIEKIAASITATVNDAIYYLT